MDRIKKGRTSLMIWFSPDGSTSSSSMLMGAWAEAMASGGLGGAGRAGGAGAGAVGRLLSACRGPGRPAVCRREAAGVARGSSSWSGENRRRVRPRGERRRQRPAAASRPARKSTRPPSTSQPASMQFWKPGTVAPGSTEDREAEAEGSLAVGAANKYANLSLQAQRERLPIFRHRASLLQSWQAGRTQRADSLHVTPSGRDRAPVRRREVSDRHRRRPDRVRQDDPYVPPPAPCSPGRLPPTLALG